MTDKQIIIDGEHDMNYCEDNNCKHYGNKEQCEKTHCYYRCYSKLYTKIKAKEQECEAIGQAYLETNELLQEKTKECTNLKAENERLKNAVMLKCPQCGEVYLDPIGAKLYETLAEIKEITKNMNKQCFYNDFDCKNCDMENGCTYFNKKQILQKISKCDFTNN